MSLSRFLPTRPRPALLRRRSWLLLWLAACVAGPHGLPVRAEPPKEYQLKAAFLYNFTRFVDWPATKFAAAQDPLVIAIWKSQPFADGLASTIGERKSHGRAIVVRTCSTLGEAQDAHLVFIDSSEREGLGETIRALHAANVLTVGESRSFADAAGIITFAVDHNKLRFEINLESGDAAGLRMSAQLLKLATRVHR